jgi:hypothetical protein
MCLKKESRGKTTLTDNAELIFLDRIVPLIYERDSRSILPSKTNGNMPGGPRVSGEALRKNRFFLGNYSLKY